MPLSSLPRIVVLGAGHAGPVIARIAVAAGYAVSIATSDDPKAIELITTVLAPGAEPRCAPDAIRDAEIVVLAIPVHRFPTFDPSLVAGRLVVDTMNYWPPVHGLQDMLEDRRCGSETVQRRLARSAVVKALNHLGYHELEDDRRPAESPLAGMGDDGDDRGRWRPPAVSIGMPIF